MKKIILIFLLFNSLFAISQEHFSGISTSNRVGILNSNINPAELPNLSKKFEVNIYGMSFNVANNKIGFSDFSSDTNLETLLFTGTDPVNARINTEIMGPGFAMKWNKWGFAFTTKAHAMFDMVNVDPTIGNAITNDNLVLNTTLLNNSGNQKLSGTSYGEIGLSAGRTIYEKDNHKFSVGITLKILFPGSYSNFGLSKLDGTIVQSAGNAYLTTNSPASLNIAYSGNLAESFSNFDDYSKSIFGGLNGFSGDIGLNYQYKSVLNLGLSLRNLGSMTFKDDNNYSTNYVFTTQGNSPLDLSLFNDIDNLSDVEQILIDGGYLSKNPEKKDFSVKLPTTINAYADVKIIPKFYVTAFLQQKTNKDEANEQITASNIFSITPRVNLGFFEGYIPLTFHEISGTNVGIGFRLGGFYLGTSSMITALINDSKQGDVYLGFRWGFL
ncbi:DUF5723 family protein [Flavobacterium sp.]|uniref:DUF5723 family protein n=1 Tax=Flavobacterium sp. TaxID=239 RepID=UPI0035B46EC8